MRLQQGVFVELSVPPISRPGVSPTSRWSGRNEAHSGRIGPTVGHSAPRGALADVRLLSQKTIQIEGISIKDVQTVPQIQFRKNNEPGRITISYQTPAARMLMMASGTRYFHAKFISRSTRMRGRVTLIQNIRKMKNKTLPIKTGIRIRSTRR